jgi:hypothetical protein
METLFSPLEALPNQVSTFELNANERTNAMTTTKPRTPKTSSELKQQLEAAKKKVAELEKRAYAGELMEMIAATSIVADMKKIQENAKDVNPTAILSAIATAAGLKRITVTQAEAKPRKPVDPNKPKKPRATAKSKVK